MWLSWLPKSCLYRAILVGVCRHGRRARGCTTACAQYSIQQAPPGCQRIEGALAAEVPQVDGTVHVEIAPRARRRRRGTEATRTAAAATARRAVAHEQRRARQARSHANRLEAASAVQQREPETREAVRAFHAGDKRRRAEVDAEARRETPSSGSEARSKEPRINDAARRARRLAQILLARGECEAQARASRALRRGAQLAFGHGRRPSGYAAPPLQLANRDRRDREAGKELGGRRVTGRGT